MGETRDVHAPASILYVTTRPTTSITFVPLPHPQTIINVTIIVLPVTAPPVVPPIALNASVRGRLAAAIDPLAPCRVAPNSSARTTRVATVGLSAELDEKIER